MKLEIDGVQIAYEDRGEGTPVLFVHGYPLSRAMWEAQAQALSPRFRVITVDLRGHGESDAPLWLYTMDRFAEDLKILLDHLSIDRVVMAGFSMGGYITFAFYRRYKEQVRAIILADTRPQADGAEGKKARFQAAQTARLKGAGAIAEAMIPKLMTPQSAQDRPDLVQKVRAMITATPVEGIAGDLMAMSERPDSTPLLERVDCPTLVVVGEQDVLTPPADAKLMADRIKKSQIEIIPEAGHLANMEQPDRFNRVVDQFLESL